MRLRVVRVVAGTAVFLAGTAGVCGEGKAKGYWVKLVCESADKIATVQFAHGVATLEGTADTRILQSDISGPHGIAFSPDRKNFYVTIGHGRPYGTALKYDTATEQVVKQVGLGLFPATADQTGGVGNLNSGAPFTLNVTVVGAEVPPPAPLDR